MSEPAAEAAIRVVLVDDHQMLSELLASALSQRDDIVVVGVAASGRQAVPMVAALHPDVVILDYDLPDTDGVSLVGPMIEAAPGCRVLMLTSFTDSAVLNDAIEAGCAGFVTKRNSTEEIISAVHAAHSDEVPVSPDMIRTLVGRDRTGLGADLTSREIEVLRLAAKGLSNKAIAEELIISVNTVRNHMQRVLNKLGAHSKLEATAIAVQLGIVRR